jgi:hypothetical protein
LRPRTQLEFEDNREDPNSIKDGEQQQVPPSQAGHPPPIVLTEANLILLQKQLKGLVKGNFEFYYIRDGTKINTK